jgi:hypothetical protein
MDSTLALTALTMGLVGGPHCVGMCASACVALSGSGRLAVTAVIRGPQPPAQSRTLDLQALAWFMRPWGRWLGFRCRLWAG